MDIRLEDREGILVIRPIGDLTAQTAPNLRAIFEAHITKANPSVVLDASDIKYMDSAGLGSLISGLHRAREYAGQFLVCGLQEDVSSIFQLTKMDSLFKVFPSADQAVVALEV